MFNQVELLSAKEKLSTTQKLLSKIEKELELFKNSNRIESPKFLEIITKTFQTYELCAQEFCFELDLLQLPFVASFFKQYMQGYHKFLNIVLKHSSDKWQASPTSVPPRSNPKKKSESDSSPESSPENKKKDESFFKSNENNNNKGNLYDKFQKIDQMTKVQMQLNNPEGPKKSGEFPVNMLPLTGKPAGVDNTTHRDRKSYTIQLLRLELLNQQNQNQSLSKKYEDANKRLNDTEIARKNLEEEILRLVKLQKTLQNNTTKMLLSENNSNLGGNRVGGGFEKKASVMMRKSELNLNQGGNVFSESTDINEYLKNVQSKRKEEEERKNKEELDQMLKKSAMIPEKKEEVTEEEKQELDEMNAILEKRDKTFSQIKDSGATKELRQFLRKMAERKNQLGKIESDVVNEFDEFEDPDSPRRSAKEGDTKKVTVRKNHTKRLTNVNILGSEISPQIKKKTADKGTAPDPLIFDIDIIDAMKFTAEKYKSQIANLESENSVLMKELKRLGDELLKIRPRLPSNEEKKLDDFGLRNKYENELISLKSELNDAKKAKQELENKVKSKKAKIKFLKAELANSSSSGKQQDSSMSRIKQDQTELKTDLDKMKTENKSLKAKIEFLILEIEKLKRELALMNEDYQNSKSDFDRIEYEYRKVKEGFNSANSQIVLLENKSKMLEEVVNGFEEGQKKLEELKKSDTYKQNLSEIQKNQEGLEKTAKNIETSPIKISTPRKAKNIEEIMKSIANVQNLESELNDLMTENKNETTQKENSKNKGYLKATPEKPKSKEKNQNPPKQNSGKPVKSSNFKAMQEESKPSSSYHIEDKDINNFNEHSMPANKEGEKVIKNLQNRLQIEIIQKEHILREKQQLEEEVEVLRKGGVYEPKASKPSKNKSGLPPITNPFEDQTESQDRKNKPIQIKINDKSLKSEHFSINSIPQEPEQLWDSGDLNSKIQAKLQKKAEIPYQISSAESGPLHASVNLPVKRSYETPQKNPSKRDSKFVNLNNEKYQLDKQSYGLSQSVIGKLENPSQQSITKIENGQTYDYPSFENISNNMSLINSNTSDTRTRNEIIKNAVNKREEEKKKEEEKINVMFENMRDIVNLEGDDLLKNENPEIARMFQKILKKAANSEEKGSVELGIEDFKEAINELKVEHRRCGPNCIHLKRFYEKLGFSEKKLGKKLYYLHKRIINRLPQLA